MDAWPEEEEETTSNTQKSDWKVGKMGEDFHFYLMIFLSFTQNLNPPDWAISSFITAAHHQFIISNLRHGEVHEVPASDVDLPIDVAWLSEHDLADDEKHGRSSAILLSLYDRREKLVLTLIKRETLYKPCSTAGRKYYRTSRTGYDPTTHTAISLSNWCIATSWEDLVVL